MEFRIFLRKYILFIILLLIGLAYYFNQTPTTTSTKLTIENYFLPTFPIKFINLTTNLNLTGKDYEELYEKYATSNEILCGKEKRIGARGEGGWDMCIDDKFIPRYPCLIYSFGIRDEWSFDDASDKLFGCVHRAFDPSMSGNVPKTRGRNIFFYRQGLSGRNVTNNKLWTLKTLATFKKEFNDTLKVIDFLKIDVEQWEWEILQTAIEDGSLVNVKQLAMEFHTDEMHLSTTSIERYKTFLKLFQALRDDGFYMWKNHLNPQSFQIVSYHSFKKIPCCHEFNYLNGRYFK